MQHLGNAIMNHFGKGGEKSTWWQQGNTDRTVYTGDTPFVHDKDQRRGKWRIGKVELSEYIYHELIDISEKLLFAFKLQEESE